LQNSPEDCDPLLKAYRAAKAKHDALIADVKRATTGRARADPEMLRRQASAALEEYAALAALRGQRPVGESG
jgi:hypothetical protein